MMSPRHLLGMIFVAVNLMASSVQGGESDAIVGTWLVEDKTGRIKIFKCGDKYCGKTIWIKPSAERPDPSKILDVHNPNPKKRGQKLLGKTILWGLTFDADDKRWEGGSIYDTRRGKVFSCQITMKGKGKLLLRGFVGISLIGQTTVWTRIN